MNTRKWLIASGTVILVMLALAAGISLAQEPEPPEGNVNRVSGVEEAAAVSSRIPVQGRLTDASGNPLNGTYSIRFALYDAATGDNTVCADTNSVSVENGLFYSEIWGSCDSSDMNGRQLYLGIKVGSDDEMTDRQAIYPVPYAFSLKPGAVISGSSSSAILTVENHGSGTGVAVSSSDGDGVSASSNASDHAAVYGYNSNTGNGVEGVGHAGVGVRGTSFAGVGIEAGSVFSAALRATGTGIIQSTAKSYVWISGNGVRPYQQSDTTVIDMDTVGGALIYRGATTGDKNVMLPITVVGPLYGQDVTISALDIYWKGDTDFDAIAAVILRRQTGVCSSASCYADIVFDVGGTGYTCEDSVYPEGCTLHYDATSNNVLTADSGILYLTLGLAFSGSGTWVEIGGVRLTLEHD